MAYIHNPFGDTASDIATASAGLATTIVSAITGQTTNPAAPITTPVASTNPLASIGTPLLLGAGALIVFMAVRKRRK